MFWQTRRSASRSASAVLAVAIVAGPAFSAELVRAADLPARVAGRTIAEWQKLAEAPSADTRLQAAASLSRLGPAAVAPLAVLSTDDVPAVRIWALRGMKRQTPIVWTDEQVRLAVERATVALTDSRVSVRIAAASTLASHGKLEPALDTLAAALSSPIPGARIEAIAELKQLGNAARPVLDAIRKADDAPNAGDYVTRIRNQILQDFDTVKEKP